MFGHSLKSLLAKKTLLQIQRSSYLSTYYVTFKLNLLCCLNKIYFNKIINSSRGYKLFQNDDVL